MRTYPWATPMLIGAVFVSALVSGRLEIGLARALILVLMVGVTAIAALTTYGLARIGNGRLISAMLAATPTALTAGAFGCFLLVETAKGRLALALTAVALTAVYLAYIRGMVGGDQRFRTEDFFHLSLAIHVISLFLILIFAFGISDYLRIPALAMAAVVALTVLLVVEETLRRSGELGQRSAAIAAAFVAVGVQLYAALSFLPTSPLVNAAVFTVLVSAGLHMAVSALAQRSRPLSLGRQFALTMTLVTIVLSTARWA